MTNPLVSVIMSEFNTPKDTLQASIESVLSQSFSGMEIIVVDDSGNNRLKRTLSISDSRVRILDNEQNKGLTYSLNRAISEARGEYLVRMDTDDICTPDRIKLQLDFIMNNPQYSVVGALAEEFSGNDTLGILGISGEKMARDIMRGDTLVHPSVIMRKADIIEVGCYQNYHRSEDLALWFEMLLHGKRLFVMDKVLLRYRVDEGDYKKRTLHNRRGEIKVRLKYYPKLEAGLVEYLRIMYTILAGLAPVKFVRWYRSKFVLRQDDQRKGYLDD